MADEHDKWLDGETSERLLRGEPLGTVDAGARDRAGRLAGMLGALAAQGSPALGELPGEKAALAAFRDARVTVPGERAYGYGGDAGVVRIGAPAPVARRSRWGRPVRLGLAAALAAGTLGGVAVAAGSGVLPGPFRHGAPRPGASVSAAASPARPSGPASPAPSPGTSGTPDVTPGAPAPDDSDVEAGGGGTDGATGRAEPPASGEPSHRPGARWWAATAACRDLRDGREPEAGNRRALEGLAGSPTRVKAYCRAMLAAVDADASERLRDRRGTDGGAGDGPSAGNGDDKGDRYDDNQGDQGGSGEGGRGDGDGREPRTRTRLNLPSVRQIPSDLRLCHFRKFVSERCDVSGRGGAVLSEPTGHRPSH
ncbi:extensin [Streptomyces sp. NPDC085596]|uniref:extensin n=1 Tax=Streptomyces sp. NPDC085596 TaxID=3365731 RepID=UPI0037D12809